MNNALVKIKNLKKCPPNAKVKVYYGDEEKQGTKTVKRTQDRMTLAKRMDRMEMSINKLAEEMRAGFKQVNTRIDNLENKVDNINNRLDYIVSANNLKDLPKSKQ